VWFGVPDAWAILPGLVAVAYFGARRTQHSDGDAASRASFRWLLARTNVTRFQDGSDAPGDAPSDATLDDGPTCPVLSQQGEFWRVAYGDTAVMLRHQRGLVLLAHLMRHAGRELHVRELDAMTPAGGSPIPREAPADGTVAASVATATSDVLDDRAESEYRGRIMDLRAELEEAQQWRDTGRAERIGNEIGLLVEQLESTAANTGGASDDGERLRVAIGRRIRSAIAAIAKHHPPLGAHLEAHVSTGYFCSYHPERVVSAVRASQKLTRGRRR
jgi:hypothetical protein